MLYAIEITRSSLCSPQRDTVRNTPSHTTQSQYPNQPPLIAGVHMTGYLKSQSDTTLLKFPRNRSDKIPLHTLLTAAGVDLDQEGIYRKC